MYLLTVLTQNFKPLYGKPKVFSSLEDAVRYVHKELVATKGKHKTKIPWRARSWDNGRVQLLFLMPKIEEKEARDKLERNFIFLQDFRTIEILYLERLSPVLERKITSA